jgi:hypothetical protein
MRSLYVRIAPSVFTRVMASSLSRMNQNVPSAPSALASGTTPFPTV